MGPHFYVRFSLLVLICVQLAFISCDVTTEGLIDQPQDPYTDMCKLHSGEYYRETAAQLVCCGNDSLRLPEVLVDHQAINEVYAECSQKFSHDDASDFPTGMWKAFLCKLQKVSAFKSKDIITFAELMTFITQHYPAKIVTELKSKTAKCSQFDKQKLENHIKIEKYMECYLEAENQTCHKPYDKDAHIDELIEEDVKKTKELGCPVVPGLIFSSSIEYCCKKRTVPYPIMMFPGNLLKDEDWNRIYQCEDSFAKRERELMPEAFQVATPQTDDGEDHSMHTTWNTLCMTACVVARKNYTKSMIKLDATAAIEFYTHEFGKAMKKDITSIMDRRRNKEPIFLAMDTDSENSKPMTFAELSAKFEKADEKEQIQYYCKFIDTIWFEERRALHEYCFDEKYGNAWGDLHHSFFVQQH